MSIQYQKCTPDDISKSFLNGYKRYDETTEMYYVKDGTLGTTKVSFTNDWDEAKLQRISLYLHTCVVRGGVVVAAIDQEQVVGFGNLDPHLYYNEYINMPYIHVSNTHRGKGIGKVMFTMLEEEAKKMGAKKLYISTHPAIPAQRFYESVGTVLATTIIPELYEQEPADIHREKELI